MIIRRINLKELLKIRLVIRKIRFNILFLLFFLIVVRILINFIVLQDSFIRLILMLYTSISDNKKMNMNQFSNNKMKNKMRKWRK